MEERKGKSEDRPSQATPAQGASDQEDTMDTIVGRYAKKMEEDIRNGERFPGILPEDRAILEAMEDAMRYDDEVMKTRCNR